MNHYLLLFAIIINLTGFAVMGIDKNRSRKKQWRLSERSLFLVSGFGGSLGSLIGMFYFHHKTKNLKFMILIPLMMAAQVGLVFTYVTM